MRALLHSRILPILSCVASRNSFKMLLWRAVNFEDVCCLFRKMNRRKNDQRSWYFPWGKTTLFPQGSFQNLLSEAKTCFVLISENIFKNSRRSFWQRCEERINWILAYSADEGKVTVSLSLLNSRRVLCEAGVGLRSCWIKTLSTLSTPSEFGKSRLKMTFISLGATCHACEWCLRVRPAAFNSCTFKSRY